MARYVRRLTSLGSLGPTEERGAGLWVGYDIPWLTEELTHLGLLSADAFAPEELERRGVTSFTLVAEDDDMMRAKLGIGGTR